PLQRASSPALPTSWLMHRAFVTPAAFISSPAFRPAIASSWPTCVSTPRLANTSEPEFAEMTGIPAATAALICDPNAVASGIETTSPCGFLATAASMSWPIFTMSQLHACDRLLLSRRSSRPSQNAGTIVMAGTGPAKLHLPACSRIVRLRTRGRKARFRSLRDFAHPHDAVLLDGRGRRLRDPQGLDPGAGRARTGKFATSDPETGAELGPIRILAAHDAALPDRPCRARPARAAG